MSTYLAIFPIAGPTSPERLHREALAQLPGLIPDTTIITGPWHGHTRIDPDGRAWWVMTAPATGAAHLDQLDALRQVAHRIDPDLAAWIRSNTLGSQAKPQQAQAAEATARTVRRRARSAKHRLEDLDDLITAGTAVEYALARIGWSAGAATVAARRHGRPDLARICGQVGKALTTAA